MFLKNTCTALFYEVQYLSHCLLNKCCVEELKNYFIENEHISVSYCTDVNTTENAHALTASRCCTND